MSDPARWMLALAGAVVAGIAGDWRRIGGL